jgi:hypothetical protein
VIRVQLVVTGRAERKGLHTSIERACRLLAPRSEFVFLEPHNVESFTSESRSVSAPLRGDPTKPDPARKMAVALIEALTDGRRRSERADYAFAIDDLEVVNRNNPRAVTQVFSAHMDRALSHRFGTNQADLARRKRVCERSSFHLLAPMLEAYFFSELSVLRAAGAAGRSLFDPKLTDLEQFRVDDPEYGAWCVERSKAVEWCCQHPKWYVKYLSFPQRYRETHDGFAALEKLRWGHVVQGAVFTQFARSLLDDVVEALEPGAGQAIQGQRHPLTELRPGRFLRNIDP